MTAFTDQAQAAVKEAREAVQTALGLPESGPSPRGTSPLFNELWQRYQVAPRCQHLHDRPIQPWLLALPWNVWHCRPCAARHAETHRGRWLGDIEEHTCDRCRRLVSSPMKPAIVRQDFWTIVLTLCRRCYDSALESGAREIPLGGGA